MNYSSGNPLHKNDGRPADALTQSPNDLAAAVNTNLLQLLSSLYGQAAAIAALQASAGAVPCAHTKAHQELSAGITAAITLTSDTLSKHQRLAAALRDPTPPPPALPPFNALIPAQRVEDVDVVRRLEMENNQLRHRLAAVQARNRSLPSRIVSPAVPETTTTGVPLRSRKRTRMEMGSASGDDSDSAAAPPPPTRKSKPAISVSGDEDRLFGLDDAPPTSRKRHGLSARFVAYASSSRARVLDGYLTIDTPNTTVLAHALVPPRALPVTAMDVYLAALIKASTGTTDRLKNVLSIIASGSPLESVSASAISEQYPGAKTDRHGMMTCAMRWAMRPMVAVQELDACGAYRPVWERLFKQLTAEERVLAADSTLVLMVGVELDTLPDGLFAECEDFDSQTTMFRVRERIGLVHLRRSAIACAVVSRIPLPDPALLLLDDNVRATVPPPQARKQQLPPKVLQHRFRNVDTSTSGSESDDDSEAENGRDSSFELDSQTAARLAGISRLIHPMASPLNLETLIFALPSLPPSALGDPLQPPPLLALPSALEEILIRRVKRNRPRFVNGCLTVHQPGQRVCASALVPARRLDSDTLQGYLSSLISQRSFSNYTPAVIRPLLLHGFGNWMPHAALVKAVTKERKRKSALDSMHYAIFRPAYIVASVDRDFRPDLWNALAAAGYTGQIPADADLSLMITVECQGLEEPTATMVVPKRDQRLYTLRERVAIVANEPVAARRRSSWARAADHEGTSDDEASDAHSVDDSLSEASFSSDSDQEQVAAGHTPRLPTTPLMPRHSHAHLALPTSFARTSSSRRVQRYISGRLQVSDGSIVLADQLAPPRPLPTDQYIALVHQHARGSLTRDIFAYAINLGPDRHFARGQLVRSLGVAVGRDWGKTLRRTLVCCMIRPLFVVGGELDSVQYAQVYAELVAEAVARGTVPDGARLVRLLGLELCGFEYPVAEDVVPAWDDRRFVIRERYALVV